MLLRAQLGLALGFLLAGQASSTWMFAGALVLGVHVGAVGDEEGDGAGGDAVAGERVDQVRRAVFSY